MNSNFFWVINTLKLFVLEKRCWFCIPVTWLHQRTSSERGLWPDIKRDIWFFKKWRRNRLADVIAFSVVSPSPLSNTDLQTADISGQRCFQNRSTFCQRRMAYHRKKSIYHFEGQKQNNDVIGSKFFWRLRTSKNETDADFRKRLEYLRRSWRSHWLSYWPSFY